MFETDVHLFCDTCQRYPSGAAPLAMRANDGNWVQGRCGYTRITWGVMGPILPEGWLWHEANEVTNTAIVYCSVQCAGKRELAEARHAEGHRVVQSNSYYWCQNLQCFHCSNEVELRVNSVSCVHPPGWGYVYGRTVCAKCATPEYLRQLKKELEKDRRRTVPEEEYEQ